METPLSHVNPWGLRYENIRGSWTIMAPKPNHIEIYELENPRDDGSWPN
jgi:hypothetical protein